MELVVGKTYTTQELIKALDISQSTWDHSRDKYLMNLSNYYEYEVNYIGRRRTYTIIKKLGDYRKPPNKRSSEERNAVYQNEITGVIEADPIQTAANVTRIILHNDSIKAFEHTDGTVYEYTRLNMKTMFGNGRDIPYGTKGEIIERVWCRLDLERNMYIEMKQEAIDMFKEILKAQRSKDSEYENSIIADFQAGLITKEERDDKIGESSYAGYVAAQSEFYNKYGYRPLKIPVYSIFAIDKKLFEESAA